MAYYAVVGSHYGAADMAAFTAHTAVCDTFGHIFVSDTPYAEDIKQYR